MILGAATTTRKLYVYSEFIYAIHDKTQTALYKYPVAIVSIDMGTKNILSYASSLAWPDGLAT